MLDENATSVKFKNVDFTTFSIIGFELALFGS